MEHSGCGEKSWRTDHGRRRPARPDAGPDVGCALRRGAAGRDAGRCPAGAGAHPRPPHHAPAEARPGAGRAAGAAARLRPVGAGQVGPAAIFDPGGEGPGQARDHRRLAAGPALGRGGAGVPGVPRRHAPRPADGRPARPAQRQRQCRQLHECRGRRRARHGDLPAGVGGGGPRLRLHQHDPQPDRRRGRSSGAARRRLPDRRVLPRLAGRRGPRLHAAAAGRGHPCRPLRRRRAARPDRGL